MTEEKSCMNCENQKSKGGCLEFFSGRCKNYESWVPYNIIVDANRKLNTRERYLAFKSEADEHFGGLNKAITDHVEGLEEIRKIDNQIITNLHDENMKLKNQIKNFNDNFCEACQQVEDCIAPCEYKKSLNEIIGE